LIGYQKPQGLSTRRTLGWALALDEGWNFSLDKHFEEGVIIFTNL
jgi:hypothetical protein